MAGQRVEGLDDVLNKLQHTTVLVKTASLKGVIKAGLLVQAGAQKKTPVDLGNLKNTGFTTWKGRRDVEPREFEGREAEDLAEDYPDTIGTHQAEIRREQGAGDFNPQSRVGFSAFYALHVHEDVEQPHVNGQSKYLQASLMENQGKIVSLLRGEGLR